VLAWQKSYDPRQQQQTDKQRQQQQQQQQQTLIPLGIRTAAQAANLF
jgi:hypothetical protein